MTQIAQPATGRTTTWKLDASHTLVEFSAKHMMLTTVRGNFNDVSGAITIDAEDPKRSNVEVEIGAASIDTRVEGRDEHLKSADFLDVEAHPVIQFSSREIAGAHGTPGEEFRVIGDLTIRGVTREVVLNVLYEGRGQDPWGGERVSYSASTRIDRRDFGLTWNQALEAGGVLVSNDIRITLEVQAVLQS